MVIIGLTNSGKRFRPSDWPERLCGCLSAFETNQKIIYSPYLKPTLIENIKSVAIDKKLKKIDPLAFKFLVSFAKDNDLEIRD